MFKLSKELICHFKSTAVFAGLRHTHQPSHFSVYPWVLPFRLFGHLTLLAARGTSTPISNIVRVELVHRSYFDKLVAFL